MKTMAYDTREGAIDIETAQRYYRTMLNQDFQAMADCLHPEITFLSPLREMAGKENVVAGAKNFGAVVKSIDIRSAFHAGNQVMMAYDCQFTTPDISLRTAVLMDFKDNLISRIELFFDAKALMA